MVYRLAAIPGACRFHSDRPYSDHGPKTAASLALVGMVLLTLLTAADFIISVSGVLSGIVPAMTLLMSLVHCSPALQ